MYGCESWTVKKAEHRRIDAFELWCWRRLLRVPWTARRSNQSILKEVSPGISLEGMMLKLKLQYFGHLMRRVDSLEKTLMLGGIGDRRRRGRQRMRWLDGITDSMDVESEWTPGAGDGQEGLACCDSCGHKESDTTERLNWTEHAEKKAARAQRNLFNYLDQCAPFTHKENDDKGMGDGVLPQGHVGSLRVEMELEPLCSSSQDYPYHYLC